MRYFFVLLILCYNSLFFVFAEIQAQNDSIDDFLSEEECNIIDSIFAISSSLQSENRDSVHSVIRQKRLQQASIDFSYQTKFYISHNASLVYRIGRILVLCDNVTYNNLSNEIIRYAKDIHNAYGCAVHVYSIEGGTAQDIKRLIKEDYDLDAPFLSGAVLIGDIPVEYFQHEGIDDWAAEDFPCDYYYMDLDGVWENKDNDECFDTHTGNKAPEVFVGRISAYLQSGKMTYLKKYFDKNHRFWIGQKIINKKRGLSFTGPDWSGIKLFRTGIQNLYGEDYTDNMCDELFSGNSYLETIKDDVYEFIQLACHSNISFHSFDDTKTPPDEVTSGELRLENIKTLGYNLFCCKACKWDKIGSMSLGEVYLYSYNSETLSLVGSTKSGGMVDGMKTFYKYLGQSDCIGTAYRIWWKDIASKGLNVAKNYRWYYGMCILGDPMVNFLYDNQCTETINVLSWNQNNSSNIHIYHAQDEITAMCEIPNNKGLELYANNVRLINGFYASSNTNLRISVDPCFDNSVAPQRINEVKNDFNEETTNIISLGADEIQVYPNPCTIMFSIKYKLGQKIRYKIFDMNGILVNSGFNNGENIDISMLSPGFYMLTVEDENNVVVLKGFKLVKL